MIVIDSASGDYELTWGDTCSHPVAGATKSGGSV
jgi:hypothetical protein